MATTANTVSIALTLAPPAAIGAERGAGAAGAAGRGAIGAAAARSAGAATAGGAPCAIVGAGDGEPAPVGPPGGNVGSLIVGAAVGVGIYHWWFHSVDKTPAVFVLLVFVVVCTVCSLLIAMVEAKPLLSALAVAVMSAPLAATAGAAVLHGLYFCDRVSRCLVGLIPY